MKYCLTKIDIIQAGKSTWKEIDDLILCRHETGVLELGVELMWYTLDEIKPESSNPCETLFSAKIEDIITFKTKKEIKKFLEDHYSKAKIFHNPEGWHINMDDAGFSKSELKIVKYEDVLLGLAERKLKGTL